MTVRSLFAFFAIALCVDCGASKSAYNYGAEFDPRRHEYVIGVADALRIAVWRNPELSGEGTVRPDGTITMPLVGDLVVVGRTPSQVREEMKRRLSEYVRDQTAIVTVAVTQVNSYRFTVAGNVAHPGSFNAKHYVTISEAIAMAGGLTRFASADSIVLIRTDNAGRTRRIPINYDSIREGAHPEQDLALTSGDSLYVP